jgi:hypothetical protein
VLGSAISPIRIWSLSLPLMMALHWTFFDGVPTDAQSSFYYATLQGVCVSWFRLLQFLDLRFFRHIRESEKIT